MTVAEGLDYRDWIGKRETAEDIASLVPVRGLLATLDDAETNLAEGDPLPPLWHWLYFLEQAPARGIDLDGHAKRGGFMPPVMLPRRMFAGASLNFEAPIPIGARITRESEIVGAEAKTGRTGALVFVNVRHRISANGKPALEETQTIVYREEGAPVPAPEVCSEWPAAPAGAWVREIGPDPVLLFRYSALVFNGHRIHYDRPYTVEEEHYPGLIVHGPLIATQLLDLVRLNTDRPVESYKFRAIAPIFDTAPYRVVAVAEGDTVTLAAERSDGATAMRAEATLG
ncbi:MAG: MaoC family dehydratase N-terminal domain-containing protein [Alphaproteobacteria bacterium]|jgi:3-methylfumaryl-CoA hydratase|nr:MaoC family dehydratase N-terminal domain-containing protein [Alphaproteobacteria bacterium]